jgi:hypothetical protein
MLRTPNFGLSLDVAVIGKRRNGDYGLDFATHHGPGYTVLIAPAQGRVVVSSCAIPLNFSLHQFTRIASASPKRRAFKRRGLPSRPANLLNR